MAERENVPNNEGRHFLEMFAFLVPPLHDVTWTSLFNDLINIFLFLFYFIISIHLIHNTNSLCSLFKYRRCHCMAPAGLGLISCLAWSGLEFMTLLPQTPECCNVSLCPVFPLSIPIRCQSYIFQKH